MRHLKLVLASVSLLIACGSESDQCEGFEVQERVAPTSCANPDPANPTQLSECVKGSGHLGTWAVDAHGLPAFDFQVEHRCDPMTNIQTSAGPVQSDPVHLIGNGRGLVAMAHASGAVELYSQDRGHKWINHVDTFRDPDNKDFPVQLGGGFNYLAVDGKVRSTRYDDLSVAKALGQQTRRFGVGYYETVTTFEDLRVTRRVFAPDSGSRALVAEVTLENLTDAYISVGLVEFWDMNQHQLTAEANSVDPGDATLSDRIRRTRRDLNGEFTQNISYSRQTQIAILETTAKALPSSVIDANSPSDIDYFPADIYLAKIDNGSLPDAVWLSDDELWPASKTSRPPPSRAAKPGDDESRSVDIDSGEQAGIMAMRVQVSVPSGAPVVRRFALGYTTGGVDAETAVAELSARSGELAEDAGQLWKERLAWMVVDAEDAGVVQRELAWSSYYTQAHATFDDVRGTRVVGRGGAAQFVAGLDAPVGDLSLHAEGLIHIDPRLARDNLTYALSSQHGSTSETPYRFPDATTGVDNFSDGENHGQRSDAYFMLPAAVARYVALTRDFEFFNAKASYWPVSDGELGSVLDHLSRALDYTKDELGIGARGLVAMGTSDFAEGLLSEAGETATAGGSSSVFNAAMASYGLPLLSELLTESQPDLATAFNQLLNDQADALENQAWNGEFYHRAFVDSGNPLAEQTVFLSSQVLPILAGVVDLERRDHLLDLIQSNLESPDGAVSRAEQGSESRDAAVVPALNAWLTEAYALRDRDEAWQSLLRNTMASHADRFPDLGYGIWTGPESFAGADAASPGQAVSSTTLANTDYPAFSSQLHLGPLRAAVALLGISASSAGWRVEPRLPSETFAVVLPRLELQGTATSLEGTIISSGDDILDFVVKLPSGAREAGLAVQVKDSAVEFDRSDDDTVRFSLPVRKDERVTWSVRAL